MYGGATIGGVTLPGEGWRRFAPQVPLPARIARRYDDVVSLGRNCQAAYQIRRLLGLTSAQIFDWIYTTDAGLVTLIEKGLDGLFEIALLRRGGHGAVANIATDTRFVHEFPAGADIAAQHAMHAGRFTALTARWRELMASDRRVLFVRIPTGEESDPRPAAARLRSAIAAQAPRLRFTLLNLTDRCDDRATGGERGILNRRLRQPQPYDWHGDDAAWHALLKEALAARVPWRRSRHGVALLREPPPSVPDVAAAPQRTTNV